MYTQLDTGTEFFLLLFYYPSQTRMLLYVMSFESAIRMQIVANEHRSRRKNRHVLSADFGIKSKKL